MNKSLLICTFLLLTSNIYAQTGNRVFAGAEAANFGTINLSTSQIWSTDRTISPGYFSNVGTASMIGATDNNNVNGYVKHHATVGDQTFSFPVGTGTDLRTIAVSGTRPANSVIAAAWIQGDPTTTIDPTDGVSHPLSSINSTTDSLTKASIAGMWDWQDVSGNAAGTTITVSIPDLGNFGPAEYVRLIGWDGNQWVKLGITGVQATTEDNLLSGIAIAGLTAIGIGSVDPSAALSSNPISLTATTNQCEVKLLWTLEQPDNVKQFDIEFSTDGKNFNKIGTTTTTSYKTYTFTHRNINYVGERFYRINAQSFQGTNSLSNVAKAKLDCGDEPILIYPNPSSDKITVTGLKESYQLKIINQLGQVLWQQIGTAKNSEINLQQFTPGNYTLTIAEGNTIIKTSKLTIIK